MEDSPREGGNGKSELSWQEQTITKSSFFQLKQASEQKQVLKLEFLQVESWVVFPMPVFNLFL